MADGVVRRGSGVVAQVTHAGGVPSGGLGPLLRRHRAAAGLTQRELAAAAGVSLGTVRDIEQGRTGRPQPKSVQRLADALSLGTVRDIEPGSTGRPQPRSAPRLAAALSRGRPDGLRLGVLGPVVAWSDGALVPVSPPRLRAVLGLLAVQLGTGVHRDALVDALWDGDPPASAVMIVQAQLSRLRRVLDPGRDGGGVIRRDGPRYRLRDDVRSDAAEFAGLTGEAAAAVAAGDLAAACTLYEHALALWRGEPLADVEVLRAHPAVAGLAWQRSAAVIGFAEAAVGGGWPDRVTGPLQELTVRDPLHEKAHALLMTALAGIGQQAAALALFEDVRRRLDAELGVAPGAELAGAHLMVLRRAVPAAPAGGNGAGRRPGADSGQPHQLSPAPGPHQPAPRQLPAAVPGFTGRAGELAVLTRLLDQAGPGGTVVISAIGGTAGVGKTALAVHWAHQAAGRFPDGQLYVNLRGFGPAGAPVTPPEAIRLFLESLGVPPGRMPDSPDSQAAFYRSLLAGRRMLIVLDNARDPAQVRPLLPGSPGCLVLVTSRNQLTGLAAAEGARLLSLDVLTEAEARDLLARRLGAGRVAAEPAAATALIRLCAGLPLALAVAAARAAARPDLPLAELAGGLRDSRDRLDGLSTGDEATDMRTVFSWSCQQLSPAAARMFQLLGLHPGPDITVAAAASLAGLPPAQTRQALAELARAHLVAEPAPGRYACHDLLRAYAAEQAASQHSHADRRAAVHRTLDHYLHTAGAASMLLHPERNPVTLAPLCPLVRPEPLDSREQALDWFRAERQVLLAAITQAAGAGFAVHAWQLPWSTATFLHWHGYWQELITTQESALSAACAIGDLTGQAHAQHFLGQAKTRLGAYTEGRAHLEAARDLGGKLSDLLLQARATIDLGRTYDLQGRPGDAATQAQEALRLYRAAGHRPGEANALNAVGWSFVRLDRYQEAINCTEAALALHRELGNQFGAATTLDSLGYAHYHLGHHAEAIACYQQALEVIGDMGDRRDQAEIVVHLGDAQHAAGDYEAACRAWQRALVILDDLDDPAATERVRARLAGDG